MAQPIVECIANYSEARRPEVVDAISQAIRSVEGARLLDRHSDLDHNRTVLTFVGPPQKIEEAAFQSIAKAAELINLDVHRGEHPRIGATDVVPFVPISGIDMKGCVEMARRLGKRVGEELGIAVYLYEEAATRPDRQNLENIRRGQYEGLKTDIQTNMDRRPDFGPDHLTPAGATVIGARHPLIAYNVYLTTDDVAIARKIAKAVRNSSGGMRFVKALGLLVEGRAQVSMNLTNYHETPVARVVEMIRREAERYGTGVHHCELVGLIPEEALVEAAVWYLQLDQFEAEQILERKLYSTAQEDENGSNTNPRMGAEAFLEALSAGTAAPGGWNAAAYSGAAGAALVAMVTRLTIGKKKYSAVEAEMQKLLVQAEGLRLELTEGVKRDAAAFEAVMAAFKLPKETMEEQGKRAHAIEEATLIATQEPMKTARMAVQVMELGHQVVQVGNLNAICDAGTAVALARAALAGAGLNVRTNLKSLQNQATVSQIELELIALETKGSELEAGVRNTLQERRPGFRMNQPKKVSRKKPLEGSGQVKTRKLLSKVQSSLDQTLTGHSSAEKNSFTQAGQGSKTQEIEKKAKSAKSKIFRIFFLCIFLGACGPGGGSPTSTPAQTPLQLNTATVEPAPSATVTFHPSPTPAPFLWVAPNVPAGLIQALKLSDGISQVKQPESANLRLEVSDQNPVSRWVYAVATPFSTITDTVSFDQVLSTWKGKSTGPFSGQPLLMDQETEQVLAALWNAPGLQGIKVMPEEQLVDYAWAHQPSWAIVLFERLEPRWKVLLVDGQSPVRKDFNLQAYTLSVPISLNGDPSLIDTLNLGLPVSNRNPNLLTTLVMTGVTALVRGTSNTMYFHGVDYPAEDIAPILQDADITHISNEVPFAPDCPLYNNTQDDLRFCTNPKYIGLLEYIGTKIVELTGDHFADNGPEAMLYTLQLYRDRGWPYYGGGANLEEGRQPAYIVHNGNRLAFIGCNAKRGGYATASATNPGAVPCDLDWMKAEVTKLRGQGYLPIVTYQHQEYYSYKVAPQYRPDFTEMADAGAVIVSGSQAHQPQNFEFDNGGLIHYGLGNLFFDQVDFAPETKDAFIDRHVFYGGRYISTELVTIQFVDMARSRLMTLEERARFLKVIFKASGW